MSSLSATQQLNTVTLPAVQAAPLANRAQLLGRMFSESSVKELAAVYPALLKDMFGFGGLAGWNLQLVTRRCHPREFDQLRMLLAPSGQLFSLIYRLVAEPHTTYEFPASCLPANASAYPEPVSAMVADPWSPLRPQPPVAWAAADLALNAFELYLHHFCYFLVNPAQQAAPIAWVTAGDALYPALLEDLMSHFLPCGGQWVAPLSSPAMHHHPPVGMTPETRRFSSAPRLLRSSLLRPSVPPAGPSSGGGPPNPETWRSEALLRTAAAFWLESGARPSSASAQGTPIPSHDHVRIVRMLVKHMHFFVHSSPHQPVGLDEFKRQAQAMLQRKLYRFMRHTFQHWPSDTSFRLVLETWLSYIQPWRYTDPANKNRSPGATARDTERLVEPMWGRFVAENLLFYTAIFRQLLPRFHRVDLTVPRYAYMVFRLSKVMCQPDLAPLIREAEAMLGGVRGHSKPASVSDTSLLYSASVGQHILELEDTGYAYQSMFDATCRQQVHTLVRLLADAHATVHGTLQALQPPSDGSFWSSLLSALGAGSAELTSGEFSPEEARRGVSHLDGAVRQLAQLYDLPVPESRPADCDSPHTPAHGQPLTPAGPGVLTPSGLQSPGRGRIRARAESVLTPDGPRLTARGRQQLMSKVAVPDLSYRGDPDRRPVQSCESSLLLRLMLALGQHINQAYGPTLADLYGRDDLAGYVSRQFINAPATYYHLVRIGSGLSTRQALHRPASVSLRWLADWRCAALLLAALLLLSATGLSVLTALLLLLLLRLVWAVGVALLQMSSDRCWPGSTVVGQAETTPRR